MYGKPPAYNTYATMLTIDFLFMDFSCSQNVNKEIIIRTLGTLVKLMMRQLGLAGILILWYILKMFSEIHFY